MGAGAIKQGYIRNHFEDMMMGRVGKLTRKDMRRVSLIGSNYPKVYICSPFAAYGQNTVQTNITEAMRYCRYAIAKKYQPVASHLLYPQMLDDRKAHEREMGLAFGLSLLRECSEVWVFKRWDGKVSAGMALEIEVAKRLHIPVIFVNDPKAYGMYGWNPLESDSERKEEGDGCIDRHGHRKPRSEPCERDHSAGGDGLSECEEAPAGTSEDTGVGGDSEDESEGAKEGDGVQPLSGGEAAGEDMECAEGGH